MTHPEAIRASLAASRDEGASFPVAWEIATTAHPLDDFMEGHFDEGRDSEGRDFPKWLRNVWEWAYDSKPFSRGQKPVRLEPRNTYAEGTRKPLGPRASSRQCVCLHDAVDTRGHDPDCALYGSRRCKSGDRCNRAGGRGITGRFCEHHADELRRIGDKHNLGAEFDFAAR